MNPGHEPKRPLGHAVRIGVAWSAASFAITKALSAASLLVLTRLLAPGQFGVVAAMTVLISVIEVFADLGMSASVIYEQGHGYDRRVDVAFTVNMMLVTALTVVAFAAAPLLASFFHAQRHVGLFRLISLDIFITGLGQIHDGLLLRDLRFNRRILALVLASLVQAALGVMLALAGLGAASLVWGMIGGTTAGALALWLITGYRPRLRFDREIAASILPYGIGASALSLVSQITNQVDAVTVGRVLGDGALGLYTVAFRIPTLALGNIANQVSLVAFPALARKRVTDRDGVAAATYRLVHLQTLFAMPLAVGMALMARPIVITVFSAQWTAASGAFAAVSVMSGISASAFALGDAFKALGRQRLMFFLSSAQLPLIVVTILLVAPYGITAVAWARAAGEAIWLAMMVRSAASVLRVPVAGTASAMWPGLAASVGAFLGVGAVRLWVHVSALAELAAATGLGVAGALAVLALLSPATLRDLRDGELAFRGRRGVADGPPDPQEEARSAVTAVPDPPGAEGT